MKFVLCTLFSHISAIVSRNLMKLWWSSQGETGICLLKHESDLLSDQQLTVQRLKTRVKSQRTASEQILLWCCCWIRFISCIQCSQYALHIAGNVVHLVHTVFAVCITHCRECNQVLKQAIANGPTWSGKILQLPFYCTEAFSWELLNGFVSHTEQFWLKIYKHHNKIVG